tara:strand:+ start:3687 stop:4295 length:609 start_codon:yes stop_codon:yes gene_type:complete
MTFSVSNLSCGYQDIPLLSNIGFSCDIGQAIIIQGENGIGKSTLLRCLTGLNPPMSGIVSFEPGTHIYLGHSNALKEGLSVIANLIFWKNIYGSKNIEDTISTFKLENILTLEVNSLSAGQKRLVALARVHLSQRRCWILDEPTTALDKENVDLFLKILGHHLDKKGTAIISTHLKLELPLNSLQKINLKSFKSLSIKLDDL